LTDLAVDGNVAPKTQNAAFHALLKFFNLVLKRDMGRIEVIRATKGEMVPTVLSPEEVSRVFAGLSGVHYCFATHHLWQGTNIREIQRLLGHSDVATTEIYTHVRNPKECKLVSPLDRLQEAA
jgi:site-specific recombinase XerD